MMTCGTDPEAGQPAGDGTVADPYKESLVMRAGLCALSLQIRPFDPDAADRLLQKERVIAQTTTAP